MTGLFDAMIALQREQLKVAERMLDAGRDAVAAQEKSVAAMKAGAQAWSSWMRLWGLKP